MIHLALDIATRTGWALETKFGNLHSGVQDFTPPRGASPGIRFLRFEGWLTHWIDYYHVNLITYEQAHHRGGAATHVCEAMIGIMEKVCAASNVQYQSVHSATLKKFATGSGRAEKGAMIKAAQARWPNHEIKDDNQADALWILEYAKKGSAF